VSNETFSVDELAIIAMAKADYWQPYVGTECEVIAIGCSCPRNCGSDYTIMVHDGRKAGCFAHNLRKKRPPREATTTWDQVPYWRPKQAEVTP